MTIGKDDKPLIITDGALNVYQMLKQKCIFLRMSLIFQIE